ncbi:MAG: GNAT family N-acetyltransferase [Anaerolineaceae bacterium]|nr:GNAT family N-acetyltransferase [Anaerolineaceae bacterium]
MDIRMVDEAGIPDLWTIWVRGLQEHPEAFGASYEWAREVSSEQSQEILRNIQSSGGFILGAFEAGKPVGMLNFNHQQGEKFRHKGDIGAIYVIPEARGRGIAKALIEAALEQIHSINEVEIISLSVNNDNLAAKRVYESCCFMGYGVEPKGLRVNGKDYDLLHMTREIR